MKALILVPIVATLMLGFVLQLVDIAESSSEKTLDFADDMNLAMDCAVRGIPIQECAPDLTNHEFKSDIEKTINVLNEMEEELDKPTSPSPQDASEEN